jgi:hypothetical protein
MYVVDHARRLLYMPLAQYIATLHTYHQVAALTNQFTAALATQKLQADSCMARCQQHKHFAGTALLLLLRVHKQQRFVHCSLLVTNNRQSPHRW